MSTKRKQKQKQLVMVMLSVVACGGRGIMVAEGQPEPRVGGRVYDMPIAEPIGDKERVELIRALIREEFKVAEAQRAATDSALKETKKHTMNLPEPQPAGAVKSVEAAKIEEDKVLAAFYKWMTKTPFKFKVAGMARMDSIWDSRKGNDYWHGLDFDSVEKPRLDPNGQDVNSKTRFTIVPWPELKLDVFGPDVWKAKTSAVFRTDMVGRFISYDTTTHEVKDTFNCLRLKHAYCQFDWEKTSLRIGKYYHPIAMPELSPDTVSVNSGESFDPFEYSTMFQVRHKFDPMELVAAVGRTCLRTYERNAVMPHIYLRLNAYAGEQMFCIGNDFRGQVVRLFTNKTMATNITDPSKVDVGYKEAEFIPGYVPFVAAAIKKGKFSFKTRLLYAQNASEYDIMGGWAVCQRNAETDRRCYTGLRCVNYWFDTAYVTDKFEVGCFFGVAKNLGSKYKIQKDPNGNLLVFSDYDWFLDMDYSWRIQPRLRIFRGPVIIGLELEQTRAAFGTLNDCARVCNACPTDHTRVLMSFVYAF